MSGTGGGLGSNLFRASLLAHFVAFTIGGAVAILEPTKRLDRHLR
jgi:hypothetical protein